MSVFDRRFIEQHDRDIVLDGIDPLADGALQRRALFHRCDGGLAIRTSKNLEQFRVNGHSGNI